MKSILFLTGLGCVTTGLVIEFGAWMLLPVGLLLMIESRGFSE